MLFSNNNNINNNEHFTELLDVFNNLMNYTNKSSIIKNKNSISNNNINENKNENKNENNLKDKDNIKDIVVKNNNNSPNHELHLSVSIQSQGSLMSLGNKQNIQYGKSLLLPRMQTIIV
jgi:hypothetical protein